MPKSSALFAVCFVAGLLGALVSSTALWAAGEYGVSSLLGVQLAPNFKQSWLFPQMMIGGLWGLGYFFTVGIPRHRRHWIRKALWFSLLPSAFTLFYLYPYVQHKGLAGFELGMLTPLLIFLSNLVWGFFTGFFTRLFWGR
ncbi:hypothetical protein SAMN02745165_01628 [Malonomonas rubra DSM 5091]|uniref:Uncharacterized protein n=1 Tax=Malonomonas rubra DSM 5091 TaxID=1122189 RepID=A0A1M6GQ07_MALRU|nr:hypothetical protein [Malonomonas rubra]SHJ12031.1 hypothetical protein SAMN02745165_01628 [Malonomonas rubra DSM 5091]